MDDGAVSTESCAQCGAPLADDQRYCLQCGEPRAHVSGALSAKPWSEQPRQSPLGLASPGGSSPGLAPTSSGLAPTPPGTVAGSPSARNNSLALLAGVGVLLLAMGIGVLIGRAGAGSAKVPPAQVISLGGASTTPTPTTEAPASSTAAPTKKARKAKASSAAGSSITKPAPSSAVQNLRSGGSGQSYEQRYKNLPNAVEPG
jgi:hypothetical protein